MDHFPPIPPVHVTFSEVPMPWYGTNEGLTTWATVALAVITGILAFYTALLFRAAQKAHEDSDKALKIADRNATAAQQSVDTAKSQMERSLRPYVIVEELVIGNRKNEMPSVVKVVIMNTGQTPASDVRVDCHWGVSKQAEGNPDLYEEHDGDSRLKGIIGQGHKISIVVEFAESFLDTYANGLALGYARLQLRGSVTYMDNISNTKRKTDFSYLWSSFHSDSFEPVEAVGNTMT